ncbi:Cytochrome P450 [Glarea lozoyensis ATCC 20868]|uniref:Cytochrome P450 n=1 Tax=Glarea lozoyensis (strain ATCC 20868 / MF5171) TaxID=1116229 RepID=S3E0L8_GLAL2|nr:Cytochrome P450 [Glarea lozoyensis ATCC 20868]EPE32078.1 Cytochrome P450 [Glarea lozoyensis ATCC 20868]
MGFHDIPLLYLITVPAAGLSAVNILFFPDILPGTPVSKLFIGISLLNSVVYMIWSLYIYPIFFSPLRFLPQPKGGYPIIKHGTAAFQRPAGQSFLNFIKTIPNDGLIRIQGFFHREGLLICSPEALAEVLVHKNYDFEKPAEVRNFLVRILGKGLILTEGDEHKFQRKHITPAFSFRHIKELIPVFWSRATAMRDGMFAEMADNPEADGRKVVEVNHWANKVTLDIIGVAGLGRDFKSLTATNDPLVQNYEEILEPTTEKLVYFVFNLVFGRRFVSWLPWGLNQRLDTTTGNLRAFCLDLVREKREKMKIEGEGEKDILALLIRSNCFGDDTLVDQLLTFIAAGHETTSSALTWSLYLLAQNPSLQTALRAELRSSLPSPSAPLPDTFDLPTTLESLPLLHATTNEVLRLYPSVPSTIRLSIRPTSILDTPVPANTRIQLSPWAINRSPSLWGPDAESFNPYRWIDVDGKANNIGGARGNNFCNLTFLHGPRSCIGERFARSELKALLAVVVGGMEVRLEYEGQKAVPAGVITTKPRGGMRLRLGRVEGW